MTTTRVSVNSNGEMAIGGDYGSSSPSISGDGRYIAFESDAINLVSGNANGFYGIFVFDTILLKTTRVSINSGGTQGNSDSFAPSISGDGRYIAYTSYADNLVTGDTNELPDIFVFDSQTLNTRRVSVNSIGEEANYDSSSPTISANGRYIAYASYADNLVSGDNNGLADIFVFDTQTLNTTRVNVSSTGQEATNNNFSDGASGSPSISNDGRYIAYESYADNLVLNDTNNSADIFVFDTLSKQTTRVSVTGNGQQADSNSTSASISGDGRYITFESEATNLVPGDTNGLPDIFVFDILSKQTTRVSVTSTGIQATGGITGSYSPSITKDGRYIVYVSETTNLVPGDTNGRSDIFVFDTLSKQTTRVSVNNSNQQAIGGLDGSASPSINNDGRYITYSTDATNLMAGDINGRSDIFLKANLVGTLAFSGSNYTVSESGVYANALTITRTTGNTGVISVLVTPSNGSATAGSDYNSAPITVSFATGETIKTLTIPIVNDTIFEPTETFNLKLSNPTGGATIGTQSISIVTILDNDLPPVGTLAFTGSNYTVNESGVYANALTITRTTGNTGAISVLVTPSNGSATAGSDYNSAPITVSFATGETIKTLTIPIINDAIFEPTEAFNLKLSNPIGGASIGTQSTSIVTILDNDPAPVGTLAFSGSNYTVNESGVYANALTITRTAGNTGAISVLVTPSNGSATAPQDFSNTPITVSFATGETIKTLTIPIVNDAIFEPTETFNLKLSNPIGGANLGTQSTSIVTILDNDLPPVGTLAFTGSNYTVNESGVYANALTITRTTGNTGAISVLVTPSNGSATAPQDFSNTPITVSFASGQTLKTLTIPIVNDTIFEPTETFNLKLSNPTGGATIGTQSISIVTILDNDPPPIGALAFSGSNYTVNENGVYVNSVTITRTAGNTGAISVLVTPSNDNATAPQDFSNAPITVSFATGQTIKTVIIPIVNDTIFEPRETFNLKLSNPTGGASLGTQSNSVVTIIDNDPAPAGSLAFTGTNYTVNESGVYVNAVTITRTSGATGAVSALVTPTNGSATAPQDFSSAPITVSFSSGQTIKTLIIPIVNDTIFEPNQSFNLKLSNPTGGASIGTQSNSVVTIIDNDPAPAPSLAFSAPNYSVNESGVYVNAVTITRTGSSTAAVSVVLTSSNGTAITPHDYKNPPITVFLGSGQLSKTVIIPIVNDGIIEPNETINLKLSNPTGGATLGTLTSSVLTIQENDKATGINQTGSPANETFFGGSGNDYLDGLAGNDTFSGSSGNDTLLGGVGNDSLIGGAGTDYLNGGAGSDRFTFNSPSERLDNIGDFNVTDDTIFVKTSGFGAGLLAGGAIPTNRFVIGTAATASTHRFIYNKTTGALLFDSDGNGATAAVQIAGLSANLSLTNLDIVTF